MEMYVVEEPDGGQGKRKGTALQTGEAVPTRLDSPQDGAWATRTPSTARALD